MNASGTRRGGGALFSRRREAGASPVFRFASAWAGGFTARFTLPLVAGLLCMLLLLFALGYKTASDELLLEIDAQVRQLQSYIVRQDIFSRRWIPETAPLVRELEEFGAGAINGNTYYSRRMLENVIATILEGDLARSNVVIYMRDTAGALHGMRFAPGVVPLSFTPRDEDIGAALAEMHSGPPGWRSQVMRVNGELEVAYRYMQPLFAENGAAQRARSAQAESGVMDAVKEFGGPGQPFGILRIDVATPWFKKRMNSIRAMTGFAAFLMDRVGAWTLPPPVNAAEEKEFARLNAAMREKDTGHIFLRWRGSPHICVFMPLLTDGAQLGILIPKDELFGRLYMITAAMVAAAGVLMLLALYFLRKTSTGILRPLRKLGRLAERLAQGDFSETENGDGHNSPSGTGATSANGKNPDDPPDEPARLRTSVETLRAALRRQERDVTQLAISKERIFGEMELAGRLQRSLYQGDIPVTDTVSVAASLFPVGTLSSAMFDCFFRSEDEISCVLASVSARGVPAALLLDRVVPLLHELLLAGLSPARALENANHILTSYSPLDKSAVSPLASVYIGTLHKRTGRMVWACAGKTPPCRIFAGKAVPLPPSGGLPLGATSTAEYHDYELHLLPGETLFACSDRLLAIPDKAGSLFGETMLAPLLAAFMGKQEELPEFIYTAAMEYAGITDPSPVPRSDPDSPPGNAAPGVTLPEDIALTALCWHGSFTA
ncbi:SpoIIE family protein phosphatase [Desulfovibrio sp. OttesenSCG-928-I05]|nr:SpoIIE family protein phosphatase [Desulfovibrio sp. OttesenSCG-928-I05]